MHAAGVRTNRKITIPQPCKMAGVSANPDDSRRLNFAMRQRRLCRVCNLRASRICSATPIARQRRTFANTGRRVWVRGSRFFGRVGIARLGVVGTQILGHVFHAPQLPEKGNVQSEARRPSLSRPTGCIADCRGAEEPNPKTSSKAISKHRRPGTHQDRSANLPEADAPSLRLPGHRLAGRLAA